MGGSDEREASDDTLVAEALDGRVRALDTLLRRHEGRVLRVARLLGVRPDDREDVAQEVFVRIFRHLGGFRPGHPFSGWVYRITVNAVHDYRRQSRRRSEREVGWIDGLEEASPDTEPGPGARLERRERQRRLEVALATLSERERAVFVLREVEGLETREVARTLGISTITIRRHLGRARRHLQEALDAAERERNSESR